MTLVIAKIEGNNLYIESDSKITDDAAIRTNPLCGLLKTLILHPFVCVSFAGNVHYAEKAIQLFFQNKIENLNDLLALLISINKESDNSVDFIVATIFDRVPRLFKISNGDLEQNITNAWIGDFDGFEIYQKNYLSYDESLSVKDKMKRSFKAVIEDNNINTIGDFHISTSIDSSIHANHPVFLHDQAVEIMVTEPQTIKFEGKGKWQAIPLGTAAGGSHGISYLVTVSPEYHGVAIHFTHGNFGVLFCPQISFRSIIINEVDGNEFVNKIKSKYGIPLRGFIKSTDSTIQLVDSRQ